MESCAAKVVSLNDVEGEWLNILGDRVRVLADGATTGGKYSVFEANVSPGAGPPLHRHDREDEFFYVVEGVFRFVIDGRKVEAGPGSFLLAPKGSEHTFVNAGSREGKMVFSVTPSGLESAFRACAALTGNGTDVTPDQIGAVFEPHGISFVGPPLNARD
ncbi:MAG: cupin domain-containing protein [Phycisphaeraceae bacterium]|nr:cupin domain-containing protein [Phycisphaeraceae bacterium]